MAANNYPDAVKKAGDKTEYTEEMIRELAKCVRDAYYFATHYCQIIHPKHGRMLLQPRDYQKKMLDQLCTNRFNIFLASRQIGKSCVTGIYFLWYAMFSAEPKTLAILANKQSTAVSLLDDIRNSYENLPKWLQQGIKTYNKLSIEFENGSKIFAAACSKNALRGESVSYLMLDEFAFVQPNIAEEFWASNYPTVSEGGHICVVSTPNGAFGKFFDLWRGSVKEENEFTPTRIDWWEVPGRDEDWKEKTIRNLGKVTFSQEYGNDFLGASYTLIETEKLSKMTADEPMWHNNEWMVYEYPQDKGQYVLGVDVANGSGNDYSVIQVLKILGEGKVEQVAVYRNNTISIFQFRFEILRAAKQFNNAHVIIENNSLGAAIVEPIWWEDEYEHVFKEPRSKEFGVKATAKTKPLACALLKRYVEEDFIKIHDKTTMREFTYFVEVRPGVYGAMDKSGCHDDTVTSLYWAIYLLHSSYWEENKDDVVASKGAQSNMDSNTATLPMNGGNLGEEVMGEEYDDLPVVSNNGGYEVFNEEYKGRIQI